MNTYMNDTNLTVTQIGPFLKGTQTIKFKALSKKVRYEEIARKLKQWNDFKLLKGRSLLRLQHGIFFT